VETGSVRTDVWVWAVRLYPSRSAAATACKGGKVHVNGRRAKPAQPVKVGDRIEATAPSGERVVVVTRLLTRRVGAALARDCYTDHSPAPEPKEHRLAMPQRERGSGRPTKKERRALDEFRRSQRA